MANETATRFGAWRDAIRAKLRQPRWWVTLLIAGVVFVAQAFAGNAVVSVGGPLLKSFAGFLSEIVKRPVGITGLVFFALLGALVVRAYWETRPHKSKSMDSLLAEHLKLDKEIAEKQHAEDERLLRERDATIKEQEKALASCQAQSRFFFQQLTYGDQLIEPAALDAANFAVMFSSVEQMMPNILAAANAASRVWQHFVSQIASVGTDSALALLVEPINDEAIQPTKKAYQLLQELMGNKKDPRPGLAAFYPRYCDWRRWILKYADLLHQNLYSAPASVEWHKHDTQLFKDLEQRFTTSHFAAVRNAARAYNENYGDQFPLPGPP